IDGATSNTYIATEAGDYTLEVTYGACVRMSNVVTVYSSCREGSLPNEFAIYPNPAKDMVVVTASFYNGQSESADIYIYNSIGQNVYFGSAEMNNGSVNANITLPKLAAGVYTFILQSGADRETTQLIITE
ncbi:MAG: T9SS type A sorting domain-containing protein, partial [Chitinophagales bacterium]